MGDKPIQSERVLTSITTLPERRRSPRIEVLDRIHGQVVALNVSLTLLDLSKGGFSIKATVAFPVGAIHEFRFIVPNHAPVVLHARVVHTLRIVCGDDDAAFVAGLEFTPRGNADIDRAIESLTSIVARTGSSLAASRALDGPH